MMWFSVQKRGLLLLLAASAMLGLASSAPWETTAQAGARTELAAVPVTGSTVIRFDATLREALGAAGARTRATRPARSVKGGVKFPLRTLEQTGGVYSALHVGDLRIIGPRRSVRLLNPSVRIDGGAQTATLSATISGRRVVVANLTADLSGFQDTGGGIILEDITMTMTDALATRINRVLGIEQFDSSSVLGRAVLRASLKQ